eukprot:GHVR01091104.1.p1 GENE.GHVR01091104.1~~GHVR01091104.1.p1  ORF type:complete len:159 (-),score=38.62 GHVR01091104.1:86-562(-)
MGTCSSVGCSPRRRQSQFDPFATLGDVEFEECVGLASKYALPYIKKSNDLEKEIHVNLKTLPKDKVYKVGGVVLGTNSSKEDIRSAAVAATLGSHAADDIKHSVWHALQSSKCVGVIDDDDREELVMHAPRHVHCFVNKAYETVIDRAKRSYSIASLA